jgi:DNA-directed RNA polymerase subunit M/transcription elongation factor TFIIS
MQSSRMALLNIFKEKEEFMNNINFLTDNSKDLSPELIKKADLTLNRGKVICKLNLILFDITKATQIENGIFEFTLITVNLSNFDFKLVKSIYYDKAHEIIYNLDPESKLQNKNLIKKIINNEIRPECVAFLSPQQLFPENWKEILENRMKIEQKNNATSGTDLYQCRKCRNRNCTITELQVRSADEPTTKFITCLVCYNTFTKN